MKSPLRFALPAFAIAATPAFAQSITEDFETANTHEWGVEFTMPGMQDPTGGNPGGRLAIDVQSSMSSLPAAMIVPGAANHPWSGDFRALGVSSFSFDRQVEAGAANFGTNLFLVLGNDGGTQTDFGDDAWVFVNTGDSFQFGMVPWATIDTDIPSATTTVPMNWDVAALPMSPLMGLTDDEIWNGVVEDVSYVGIAMGRPFNGGAWFGAHMLSLDNFELETSSSIGTTFCQSVAQNSAGLEGQIAALGSTDVAVNSLTLLASDLPANQFGIFVTSQTQGFMPGAGGTSNGNLCLTGTLGRFSAPNQILDSGPGGAFSLSVDLTVVPEGPQFVAVMAGETWNFQAWHRDTVGLGSNFTDALEIAFQ